MKKEANKNPKGNTIKKEEDRWINVHDDDIMREMGFMRPFKQTPRDKSVWSKTLNERRILHNVKNSCKNEDMHFHMAPAKQSRVCAKLIIYLNSNDVFPKSTYSFMCLNTAIGEILGKFQITNPRTKVFESAVIKYSYDGKTYKLEERPYCG